MDREPIAIINAVTAFIETVILLFVAFGLELTQDQIGAIMAAVIAAGTVVSTVMGRSRVTPV